MYHGTAPSFALGLVLLYSVYATAQVLVDVEHNSYAVETKLLQEKHAYLQRMKELYSSLAERYESTVDPVTFVRRLTIRGVVADLLRRGNSPIRSLMPYMRGNEILQESSDGSFKTVMTTEPSLEGEQCFLIEGSVDYEALSGQVRRVLPVSCSERSQGLSTLMFPELSAGGDGLTKYSNGSKGDI